jgi:DNA-binding transcriptional regulator YiaG
VSERPTVLAAMPFGHLKLVTANPRTTATYGKASHYPANSRHIGEQIKKHRYDLKMTAVECRKILGINKSTLLNWEQGQHTPNSTNALRTHQFLNKPFSAGRI